MTQKEYIIELEQEIELLDEEIAEEIIEYTQARFRDALRYENKSEADVIVELGTPRQLAKRVYESYGIKDSLWTSSRNDNIKLYQVVLMVLFDVFVASWVVPLMVFIVLTGFASFITFPVVIAAIPGLVLQDVILVMLLAIGAYSLLLLFAIGLTELTILMIKNILILNFKVITPQNKTTIRLLKNISLFSWMRRIKLGRNIFINLGMVAVTLVSFSFLFLLNRGTAIGDIFGSQQMIEAQFTTSLVSQIEQREPYNLVIQMGDVDLRLQPLAIDELRIDRAYTLQDGFNVRIDDTTRTIFITTIQDVIEEGLFLQYNATYDIFLPERLLLGDITIRMRSGDLELDRLEADDITITQQAGELFVYALDATSLTLNATNVKARLLESYFLVLELNVERGSLLVNQLNDIITDGLFLTVQTASATTTINDAYFRNYRFQSITGDVFLQNRNTIYQVESIEINAVEGKVSIPLRYESAVVG
jgi:uncharacterized membrane protein